MHEYTPHENHRSPGAGPHRSAHGPSSQGGAVDSHGTPLASLRPVDEYRRLVADLFPPPTPVDLPLQQALGRVLASDVISGIDLPPFDNSAMDGYAVRRSEIASAPTTLPVSQEIPAGAPNVTSLKVGTAARIMTGAPVPAGADLVVPVEFTDGGVHEVTVTVDPGNRGHIRPAGDDVRSHDVVLGTGTIVDAAHIGVAAATGHATLPVYRALTVLVLSTGSELAEPGSDLGPGQIYESNGQMLTAAVTNAGAIARTAHFVADDVEAFRATLEREAAGVDLVLTSGGVSAGAYEVVKDALTGAGVEFTKVAMQPGMPQGAGSIALATARVPVVALPGNPVSSFVSFEVFVRPAIRAAMGFAKPERPRTRAVFTEASSVPSAKRQFRRGVYDAATGRVAPVGGAGSHLLGALAAANCLVVLPEAIEQVTAGDEVEVWLLTG